MRKGSLGPRTSPSHLLIRLDVPTGDSWPTLSSTVGALRLVSEFDLGEVEAELFHGKLVMAGDRSPIDAGACAARGCGWSVGRKPIVLLTIATIPPSPRHAAVRLIA